ncbi:hypothetical protein BD289DRAFT_439950 [Coniella lustricola]|uniref:Altered inheritance of mitochondria protein 13, mitochondrial n=1 Tax=Coniella lustricola TaxID=2025994 RepID=A0A2T3A139_9PEZI|nr:hypothetical protein BD289DRAFT_439950 [Coniella lustricola]
MGANSSKPSGSAPTHVWNGSSPAGLSQDIIEQLQGSTENDATRNALIESQVQRRVADELRKLQQNSDSQLSSLLQKATASDESSSSSSTEKDNLSRHTVNQSVEQLRQKVEARRLVKEVPEGVEEARREVVRCLRDNDRRPLDCWQEVERFREEVRRLEKGWVERVIS